MVGNIKHIEGFHVHVYFDKETKDIARHLYQELVEQGFKPGRVHEKPMGPHTKPMFYVPVTNEEFGIIVPFLMLNREGLSVLVHPTTNDDIADHTEYPIWMGPQVPLDLTRL